MSWRRSQDRAKAERRIERRQPARPVSPALTADEETAPHRVLLDEIERDDFTRNQLHEEND